MPHLISDLGQIAIGLKPPDTTVRMPQVVKLDVVADLERISRLCYQKGLPLQNKVDYLGLFFGEGFNYKYCKLIEFNKESVTCVHPLNSR